MKTLKLGILGFGNVGKAFVKILEAKKEKIRNNLQVNVIVTGIVTGSRGSLHNSVGIDLPNAYSAIEQDGCFDKTGNDYCDMTPMELVERGNYDVIVEMTPLAIDTGQPAADYLRKAMERGKHVVTANKGPIAWHYEKLKKLAEKMNVLYYIVYNGGDRYEIFNPSWIRKFGRQSLAIILGKKTKKFYAC